MRVWMAKELGRDIATPEEARQIFELRTESQLHIRETKCTS